MKQPTKRKRATPKKQRQPENQYFGVRMSREAIDRLRKRAAKEQRTVGVVLTRIVNEHLDQIEAGEKEW